jgi:2'-hydroxyisoflavone reductase
MNLLILGGTAFLGRYLVLSALARNHRVTLFNRGQTNPDLFPETERLRGDRAGNLDVLKNRQWDAVIDTCGFASAKVRAIVSLLANSVDHYTFISSVSVYRDFSRPGLGESAPVESLPAGAIEHEGDPATYGARKALCERVLEETMPGRVLNIRPGLIVGPHDTTDRFTYWVRRVALGSDVLAPAPSDTPVQLIDVRDLADWTIRMAEAKQVGTYNATGPNHTLTFAAMLGACKTAAQTDASFVWADEDYLVGKGVKPFSELPFWVPDKKYSGFFRINCSRAFSAGLMCRPLAETARDTLVWDRATPSAKTSALRQTGLAPAREAELLQGWEQKQVHR